MTKTNSDSKTATHGRRSFFKKAAGALTAGFLVDETLEALPQNTNTNSKPSDLKITDVRIAVLRGVPMTSPIIRIDTNQGIYGLGEVRDGASKNYALELKSRILGENPCNVDRLFRKIKQFGGQARQGGGVSGIEVALWDLAGKAYNVPIYQMLGGKFRDKIRIYCDTTSSRDPKVFARAPEGAQGAGLYLDEDGPGNQPGNRDARDRHAAPTEFSSSTAVCRWNICSWPPRSPKKAWP